MTGTTTTIFNNNNVEFGRLNEQDDARNDNVEFARLEENENRNKQNELNHLNRPNKQEPIKLNQKK